MQMHANDANASNAMQKVNLHAKDAKEKEKENEKEKEKEKENENEKEKESVCIGGTPTHNFSTLQEVLF